MNQRLVFQIRLEQLLLILSIIKFFSFFRESIRNTLLFNNCEILSLFGKLDLFQAGASFFFFFYFALRFRKFAW